jgi:hypothetical protein
VAKFLQRPRPEATEGLAGWVNNEPCILQRQGTQERLGVLRAKDNSGQYAAIHELDASGGDWKLDQPAVGELVEIHPLRLDTRLAQQRSRYHAINGACIDQKIGRYRNASGKNRFNRSRHVCHPHEYSLLSCRP